MDRSIFEPILDGPSPQDGVVVRVNWVRLAVALVPATMILVAFGFKAGQGFSSAPSVVPEVHSAPKAESRLQLVAEPASEGTDSRLPLVPLGIFVRGPSEVAKGATVEIIGLPSGWVLSEGRPRGNRWRIPAAQLSGVVTLPPPGFFGGVDLAAELRLADGTLVERRSVRLAVSDPELATNNTPNTSLLLSAAESLLLHRDISAARPLLRKAAEAGNAAAALLLGETYEACPSRCSWDTDPATARTWYMTAVDLGSAEALERLDRLANPGAEGQPAKSPMTPERSVPLAPQRRSFESAPEKFQVMDRQHDVERPRPLAAGELHVGSEEGRHVRKAHHRSRRGRVADGWAALGPY